MEDEINIAKLSDDDIQQIIADLKNPHRDDVIKYIYNEYYIKQHYGVPKLRKKFGAYSFYTYFDRLNLPRRDDHEKNLRYTCDSHYFDVIDTPDKAYWLGYFYADGYITNHKNGLYKVGMSLSIEDIDILKYLQQCLKTNAPIQQYKAGGYGNGAEYVRLLIADPILAQGLIKQGCILQKTNILKFPTEEQVPRNLLSHFIRGYFDGDGSISFVNNQAQSEINLSFCGTDDMLTGIMDTFIDCGITDHQIKIGKRQKEQIVSYIKYGGNHLCKRICDYLYSNTDDLTFLKRKYKFYIWLINYENKLKEQKILASQRVCAACGKDHCKLLYCHVTNNEYYGKCLCRKHYQQILYNGCLYEPVLKKSYCEICGGTKKLVVCSGKYPEYKNKTICKSCGDRLYRERLKQEGAEEIA